MTLPGLPDPIDPAADPVAEDPSILDPPPPEDDLGMPEDAEPESGGPTRKKKKKKKKKGDPTRDKSEARDPLGAGVGDVPGVLRGGTVTKVNVADGEDVWMMSYEYPPGTGNIIAFQFDSLDQVEAVLGEDFWQKPMFQVDTRNENYLRNPKVNIVDSVAAVVGVPGTFGGVMEDLMYQTALEMGINDPTLLGEYLSNPEIQLALATGAISDWTPEQIQAEIRNTGYYQNELYPGIATIMASGEANPEAAWKQYRQNIAPSLEILGIDPADKGAVGDLLTAGVSVMEFNSMAPAFAKAANSPAYAEALNQWTQASLGRDLDFEDMFSIFDGTSLPDITGVVEQANLQFAADQAGIEASQGVIKRIARETDLSEAQIAANFDTAELQLLALGDAGLRRSGLKTQDLIRSAFDLPTGDVSALEIQQRASKFAREMGLMDDEKANLFVGFDPEGRPTRPGLGAFNPIGG